VQAIVDVWTNQIVSKTQEYHISSRQSAFKTKYHKFLERRSMLPSKQFMWQYHISWKVIPLINVTDAEKNGSQFYCAVYCVRAMTSNSDSDYRQNIKLLLIFLCLFESFRLTSNKANFRLGEYVTFTQHNIMW